jgi:hypothetical protein
MILLFILLSPQGGNAAVEHAAPGFLKAWLSLLDACERGAKHQGHLSGSA